MGDVLVVTDLDGTLWDEHQWIHDDTSAAIRELERRGIELLIATGRRLASAKNGFSLNDLWKPTVVLNGTLGVLFGHDAKTVYGQTHTTFHTASFAATIGATTYDIFRSYGHEPVLYGCDGLVYGAADATTGAIHRRSLASDLIEVDPNQALADGVLAMSILGVAPDGLVGLGAKLRTLGMFVDMYQDPLYGQWSIMAQPPGVSKQTGIDAYIAHRYPEPARPLVVAVGDGGNDVEMIRDADVGIAITGGHESVTSIADQLIAPPGQGGWASVLDVVESSNSG